jgi:hypothetical protein
VTVDTTVDVSELVVVDVKESVKVVLAMVVVAGAWVRMHEHALLSRLAGKVASIKGLVVAARFASPVYVVVLVTVAATTSCVVVAVVLIAVSRGVDGNRRRCLRDCSGNVLSRHNIGIAEISCGRCVFWVD